MTNIKEVMSIIFLIYYHLLRKSLEIVTFDTKFNKTVDSLHQLLHSLTFGGKYII